MRITSSETTKKGVHYFLKKDNQSELIKVNCDHWMFFVLFFYDININQDG
jgi:hypothetical protein